MIALLFMLAFATPAEAAPQPIACHVRPEKARYWSWREVDGRRCWYRGRRAISKTRLYWPLLRDPPPPPVPRQRPMQVMMFASVAPLLPEELEPEPKTESEGVWPDLGDLLGESWESPPLRSVYREPRLPDALRGAIVSAFILCGLVSIAGIVSIFWRQA